MKFLIEEMHGQNEDKQLKPIFLNKLQIIFVFHSSFSRTKIYTVTFRLWPKYASAYNNLGTVVRNTQEAEQLFRRAIALHPERTRRGLLQSGKSFAVSISTFIIDIYCKMWWDLSFYIYLNGHQENGRGKTPNYFRIIESTEGALNQNHIVNFILQPSIICLRPPSLFQDYICAIILRSVVKKNNFARKSALELNLDEFMQFFL